MVLLVEKKEQSSSSKWSPICEEHFSRISLKEDPVMYSMSSVCR